MSEEPKAPEPVAKNPAEPEERFLVTTSPHIRSRDDIPRIMWTVVAALMPALFASCYFFGMAAVRIILVSVVTAVAAEALIQKLTGRRVTASDGSAVVTGLLVAFVMPSNAPWFIPLVASLFAIGIVKQAFGGLGCNIWNPALAGRAFAVACFAGLTIGGWGVNWVDVTPGQRFGSGYTRSETMTGASALSARKDYLKGLPKADAARRMDAFRDEFWHLLQSAHCEASGRRPLSPHSDEANGFSDRWRYLYSEAASPSMCRDLSVLWGWERNWGRAPSEIRRDAGDTGDTGT